jgi:hypothetical protein
LYEIKSNSLPCEVYLDPACTGRHNKEREEGVI